MKLHRAYRFRLQPTSDQITSMIQISGACRFVYNLALEQRRIWARQYQRATGHNLNYISQSHELTLLRAEVDWLAATPRWALDHALASLQRAYDAFFAGHAAYPTPRTRSQGFRFTTRGEGCRITVLNRKWSTVWVTGVGAVKFRSTRAPSGKIKLVCLRADGPNWFVSLVCEQDAADGARLAPQVGIDRGIANTLAFSNGQMFSLPASIEAVDRRRRKAQRVLARRVRGSRRRHKARARVAALHARARRMRADWSHHISNDISARFGHVAIEALQIKNMTASAAGTIEEPGRNVAQKRGLNRSILNQGWGQFEQMLAYKLEATGGTLIRVPAHYTSQTCSACGAVDARSRESQAIFRCVHCGHEAHADTNAAKEILRRSTSELLVEGARRRPAEARTTGVAA